MRICLFTPTFFPKMGGQEMVVDQLARHYTLLGHEVVVFAQHAHRRISKTEVKVPYRLERFTKPFSQVWGISGVERALARFHQSWKFEILHSHSCYPTAYSALKLCGAENIPLVVTSHGGDLAEDSRFRKRPLVMKRCRQTLNQADAVTSISSYMTKSILEVAPECGVTLHSIPNGVDCAKLGEKVLDPPPVATRNDLKPDCFALFLGRLHRRKGVEVLLQAFHLAAEKSPALRLVIAGDGEEMEILRSQAEQTGLADRIHFVGGVQGADKIWLLQNTQFLVLPTPTRETFGLVLLEAMANSKPVIGTNLGGIRDLIDHGKNGLLVQPGETVELAQAMEKLSADSALRAEMGRNAAEKARLYDWPVVTKKYISLFENLLQKALISPAAT